MDQILDEYRNELICIERESEECLENPETVQKLKSIENKQKHFIDKQKHIIHELRKIKFSQRSKLSKKYVWFIIVPLQGPTQWC